MTSVHRVPLVGQGKGQLHSWKCVPFLAALFCKKCPRGAGGSPVCSTRPRGGSSQSSAFPSTHPAWGLCVPLRGWDAGGGLVRPAEGPGSRRGAGCSLMGSRVGRQGNGRWFSLRVTTALALHRTGRGGLKVSSPQASDFHTWQLGPGGGPHVYGETHR